MSKTETQSEALTAERRLFITAIANLELRKKFGDEGFRLDLERDELEALIEMAERASRLDAENKALRDALDAVAMDAIGIGGGETAISNATRTKVEAVLMQTFADQAAAKTGGTA